MLELNIFYYSIFIHMELEFFYILLWFGLLFIIERYWYNMMCYFHISGSILCINYGFNRDVASTK